MDVRRVVTLGLFWLGAALLASAFALLLLARLSPPGEGFEDLAHVAGALLLGAASALPLGLFLLSSWAWRKPVSRAKLAVADVGCLLGLVAAFAIASVNETTLLFFGLPALLVAGGGLVASVPLWRRA